MFNFQIERLSPNVTLESLVSYVQWGSVASVVLGVLLTFYWYQKSKQLKIYLDSLDHDKKL